MNLRSNLLLQNNRLLLPQLRRVFGEKGRLIDTLGSSFFVQTHIYRKWFELGALLSPLLRVCSFFGVMLINFFEEALLINL